MIFKSELSRGERRGTESAADMLDLQQVRPLLPLEQPFTHAYGAPTFAYFFLPFTGDFTGEIARLESAVQPVPPSSKTQKAPPPLFCNLTDYLFDVDWVTFEETMPQILGMCVMMAAYTFVADAIPIWLHRVEDKMTIEVVDEYKAPPIDIPPANSARFFQTRVEEAKRDTGDTQEILYPLLGTALP